MALRNTKFFVRISFMIGGEMLCTTLIVQQGGMLGGAAAGAAVVPELVVGALNCVGFTALGPAAGSIAAGIQSSIGCVAAGSPFAIAQSIAMGGMGGPLLVAGAAVGVTAVLVSTALGGNKTDDNESNSDSDEEGDGHDGEKEGK